MPVNICNYILILISVLSRLGYGHFSTASRHCVGCLHSCVSIGADEAAVDHNILAGQVFVEEFLELRLLRFGEGGLLWIK